MLLFIFGWVLLAVVVGGFMLLGVLIWALVDAFLIPRIIEVDTSRKRSRLSTEVGLTTVG